ncbi:MAG TPA: response regulator [Candidatus Solibacter sp.]
MGGRDPRSFLRFPTQGQMNAETLRLILLIEDNAADANLVEEVIAEEQLPCALQVLRDGARAIDFIDQVDADESQPRPDLVLLDLNLPLVSGEQVLKRIRLSPRCEDTKILIVSSSNAYSDRERAMALGATGYFRKPSSLDQFMELGPRIREMLGA